MARQAVDNGPDSYPAVFGARPTAKVETAAPAEEHTNTDLALPKLPPPKLAVFGPPSPGAPEPSSGTYRLGKVLGSGDLATVYEAFKDGADGFRKRVAVKRIHSHLAQDSKVVALLGDEARLSSLIQHPNVCQVLDFVDDGAARGAGARRFATPSMDRRAHRRRVGRRPARSPRAGGRNRHLAASRAPRRDAAHLVRAQERRRKSDRFRHRARAQSRARDRGRGATGPSRLQRAREAARPARRP